MFFVAHIFTIAMFGVNAIAAESAAVPGCDTKVCEELSASAELDLTSGSMAAAAQAGVTDVKNLGVSGAQATCPAAEKLYLVSDCLAKVYDTCKPTDSNLEVKEKKRILLLRADAVEGAISAKVSCDGNLNVAKTVETDAAGGVVEAAPPLSSPSGSPTPDGEVPAGSGFWKNGFGKKALIAGGAILAGVGLAKVGDSGDGGNGSKSKATDDKKPDTAGGKKDDKPDKDKEPVKDIDKDEQPSALISEDSKVNCSHVHGYKFADCKDELVSQCAGSLTASCDSFATAYCASAKKAGETKVYENESGVKKSYEMLGTGSGTGTEYCKTVVATNFCKDMNSKQCPSCTGLLNQGLSDIQLAIELKSALADCPNLDPALSDPKIAALVNTTPTISTQSVGSMSAVQRKPSSDVAISYSTSISNLGSQAAQRHCLRYKLASCR